MPIPRSKTFGDPIDIPEEEKRRDYMWDDEEESGSQLSLSQINHERFVQSNNIY
jgi:hypothetical protein